MVLVGTHCGGCGLRLTVAVAAAAMGGGLGGGSTTEVEAGQWGGRERAEMTVAAGQLVASEGECRAGSIVLTSGPSGERGPKGGKTSKAAKTSQSPASGQASSLPPFSP